MLPSSDRNAALISSLIEASWLAETANPVYSVRKICCLIRMLFPLNLLVVEMQLWSSSMIVRIRRLARPGSILT
jgi:hypothetical protein